MNKQQNQQINTEQRQKYVFQDQKSKLQVLLKEQSSYRYKQIKNLNSPVYAKNLNLASDKKQYSSQATQIQDDLLNYDQDIDKYYNLMQQEEYQDDQNNLWDKSQNNSMIMQSKYENDDSKQNTPELSYLQKNKQIFYGKNQKPQLYQQMLNDSEQGNQSFSSVIRRCSSNLYSIKQEINQKPKIKQLDDNSTQLNSNCLPSISNNNNTSELKKKIQINYKEVYKLFCSKMKRLEEDKRKQLNVLQIYNSQFLENYRTSLNMCNQILKVEDQVSYQKKIYFVSSHDNNDNEYQQQSLQKFFSNAVSRNSSVEESKIQQKNQNLAKFNCIQENLSKLQDSGCYSQQINESYSQKMIEKQRLAENQLQNLEVSRDNKHISNRFNYQSVQKISPKFKYAFEFPQQQLNQNYQIQPKRLLKKYFSVKQLNVDTSNHQKNQNIDQTNIFENMLIVKQIDNYSNQTSQFNSQKNLQFQQYFLETQQNRNQSYDQTAKNQNLLKQIGDKNKLQALDQKYFENYYA
ncbi:hypothetical protein ABPG72_014338 [Tetrahymena utriculariae]